jgi:uncharacterized protein (TIGR00369 family)
MSDSDAGAAIAAQNESAAAGLLAWLRGEREAVGMVALLGFLPVAIDIGRVVLAAEPDARHYNPGGVVHGGYTATLLDTAMGCAAQTVISAGQGVTTLELKLAYHRAITAASGRIEAVGRVLSNGRRTVFTEASMRDASGRLLASGSSTLLVLQR